VKALTNVATVRAAMNDRSGSEGSELIRATRRSFGRALLVAFAIAAVSNLAGLLVPLYILSLYDMVLTTRNMNTLVWLSVGLAFGMAVYAALEYARAVLYDGMAERAAHSLSLPALLAANRNTDASAPSASGEVIRDLGELRGFVSGSAISVPLDLAWSPLLLAALFVLHWAFALYALLCMSVLLGLSVASDLLTRRPYEQANDETVRSFAEISTALRNAEAVEGLGMLPALIRRWRRSQDLMLEKLWRATRTAKAFTATTKACRLLMIAGMVCLGLVLVINGDATGGSIGATNMILARLLLPFGLIVASWRNWVAEA